MLDWLILIKKNFKCSNEKYMVLIFFLMTIYTYIYVQYLRAVFKI